MVAVKRLFILIIFIFLLPIVVDAKEYCKVVSGNGKDLGSEIACGSERFYILNSNENEVRMLAKYNLNTGVTIHKVKLENKSCSEIAAEHDGEVLSDDFYNTPGYCYYKEDNVKYYKKIASFYIPDATMPYEDQCKSINTFDGYKYHKYVDSNHGYIHCTYVKERSNLVGLQTEDAKSAHWDPDLNYLYPQVGDVYIKNMNQNYMHFAFEDGLTKVSNPVQSDTKFFDFNINLDNLDESVVTEVIEDGNSFGLTKPLYTYKYLLNQMGYDVNDISLLSLSELDNLIYRMSQKKLPLQEWENDFDNFQSNYNPNQTDLFIHFGDLKPLIPQEYSWLYSTTYWNSSILDNNLALSSYDLYFIFTAQQGKLCGAGFKACAYDTKIGCGIRPVINIPNKLQYLISTRTDGNGTIDVIDYSLGGEEIPFTATPKEGYKLKSIVVKTDSGEKVEFKEEDIGTNGNGSLIISKNKFTMPYENVIIEAEWKKVKVLDILENPKTGVGVALMIIILAIGTIFGTYMYKTKKSI